MAGLMAAPFHVASHLPAGFLSLLNIVVVSGFQRETRNKAPVFKYFLCLWFASKQVTCPNPDPRAMKRNSFYILMEQLQSHIAKGPDKGRGRLCGYFYKRSKVPGEGLDLFQPRRGFNLFSHRPFVGTSHMSPHQGWTPRRMQSKGFCVIRCCICLKWQSYTMFIFS